jgi:threonine synthase
MSVVCVSCGREAKADGIALTCACGGLLEVRPALPRKPRFAGTGVWRYAPVLPVHANPVTLGEGATGLHRCRSFHVKHEGENPTGSFKDRGMTVGVTLARELGRRTLVCASTGNTSASLAAYAARAGLRAVVLLPRGKVAAGKVAQAVVHGAKLLQVEGDFDRAMEMVRDLEREGRAYVLNSLNPYRLEGQKTLAFEVCEALDRAPDFVVLPVGNGGNISAIWKGFKEWKAMGFIARLPRMIGVQARGAAPIALGRRVANPRTVATAIRIGDPVNRVKVEKAVQESGGCVVVVSDREILDAQRWLASTAGIFVEPASAAPIAWLRKNPLRGLVVAVTTGNGLKDPDAVPRPKPRLVTPRTLRREL